MLWIDIQDIHQLRGAALLLKAPELLQHHLFSIWSQANAAGLLSQQLWLHLNALYPSLQLLRAHAQTPLIFNTSIITSNSWPGPATAALAGLSLGTLSTVLGGSASHEWPLWLVPGNLLCCPLGVRQQVLGNILLFVTVPASTAGFGWLFLPTAGLHIHLKVSAQKFCGLLRLELGFCFVGFVSAKG